MNLNYEGASTSDLITRTRTSTYILFCNKTLVQMFYFDSKIARPIMPDLYFAALFFQKAYIDMMLFGYAECNRHGPRARGNIHILLYK